MATVRKNEARLSAGDWRAFIDAIDAVRRPGAVAPRYDDFVQVHVDAFSHENHDWGVHTMGTMVGRNFLAWHRQYLLRFERRLQQENPDVFVPYWDWLTNPRIPPALSGRDLLRRWRVTRNRRLDRDWMPGRDDVGAATRRSRFGPFQRRLESAHGDVHVAVGGEMATERSPADPIFWLHHANVDRIWARWQERHPRARPQNTSERLKPAPLLDVRVSELLKIADLDYRYR
jgi:tyrosinase